MKPRVGILPEILVSSKWTALASPVRLQPGHAPHRKCRHNDAMLAVPGAENRLFSALTSLSAVAAVPAEAGLDSLKRSALILGVAEVFQAEYPLSDYFVKEHNRSSLVFAAKQVRSN